MLAVRRFCAASKPAFYGPVQKEVEAKIAAALSPSFLEVTNESHGDVTHESHFHVHVVSSMFEKKNPLARHRMVNKVLTGADGNLPFHSLRVTAQLDVATAPEAPKCTGKGDGRGPKL